MPTAARAPGLVAEVVARFAGVAILVNNAGVSLAQPIGGPDWEERWAKTLAVNRTAEGRMVRACLPHLRARGAGRR